MNKYEIRNSLWKVGGDLLDVGGSMRNKRAGQLLYSVANLIAEYEGEPLADTSEFERKIRKAVAFAQTCKL
jgi:hypothetical protein